MEVSIDERRCDLFDPELQCAALAHCVSADLEMSAGIARLFRARYDGLDELFDQNLMQREVGVLHAAEDEGRRPLFYVVTKAKFWHSPTRIDFTKALQALARACADEGVSHLAVPRLGCGMDRLEWSWVRGELAAAFRGHSTVRRITVCSP